MRVAFAHVALLDLVGDERAPGGAITTTLCRKVDHPGPCPVAPHHTSSRRDASGTLTVRTLFACAATDEPRVRTLIRTALAAQRFVAPDGAVTRWSVMSETPTPIDDAELDHAARLCAS